MTPATQPGSSRVLWLLVANSGSHPAELTPAVEEVAKMTSADPSLRIRRGVRPAGAAFDGLEHYRAVKGRVDAALEIRSADPEADLAELARRLSAPLATAAGAAQVHALVGDDHVMVTGETDWVLIFAIRRLPRMNHKQFCDYWLSHGAAVRDGGLSVKKSGASDGYGQFHADPHASASDAFDGIAVAYWRDRQTLIERLTDRRASVEDEANFIDHAASAVGAIKCRS